MSLQRNVFLLRLVVLFILALALMKYFHRSRPSQAIRTVKEHKKEDFFWGAKKANSEEENRELPPEPPKEEKVDLVVDTQQKNAQVPRKDFSGVQMKLVHLDLKGAAPKLTYLEQIFPLLSKLGANGLLIEYEDMFPFTGELEILKSPYAYSEDDIKKILHLAEINKLEVVPLVQTFGHMEYVLKHDRFRGLREVEQYPNSLNPHTAESLPLVKMILSQVLDKHPSCSWIHIGADEVYHLGEGQDSKAWLNSNKGDLGKMFLTHIQEVVGFLHKKYPNKQQLMWDDWLRKLSADSIQNSRIVQHVSPVLWLYSPDLNIEQTESFISKYENSGFKSIWFASAFKGASTVDQMWTPMSLHVKNHQQWKRVIDSMKSKFTRIRYAGIALTGWQRYDHYSVLCELLPVGIPSLAMCLQALQHGELDEKVKKETASLLGFKAINIETNTCDGSGAFAGADIYSLVQKIHKDLKLNVQELLEGDSEIKGWFSRYHRKHRFGNPHKMEKFSSKLLKAHEEWESLTQSLRTHLESIYFPDTVEEWMEENVNPHLDQLREVVRDFQEILKLNGRPKEQAPK